mgnify:CR=1 FL=1
MKKPEYSFIRDAKSGCYFLVKTKFRHVAVWGIGGHRDRKKALKQAREYCRNMFATLHIEG